MKKTRFTAMFLCVTTLFSLFAGGVYAEEGVTYIDETTLVIEDGKVVSGDKSLVDKGIVVIGDSSESPEEAPVFIDDECKPDLVTSPYGSAGEKAETDLITPPFVSAEEEAEDTFGSPLLSGKTPVKDNSALLNPDSSTGDKNTQSGVTLPEVTPLAFSEPTWYDPRNDIKNVASAMWCVDCGSLLSATWEIGKLYQLAVLHAPVNANIKQTYKIYAGMLIRGYVLNSSSYYRCYNSIIDAGGTAQYNGALLYVRTGANVELSNYGTVNGSRAVFEGLRFCYNEYYVDYTSTIKYSAPYLANYTEDYWDSNDPYYFTSLIVVENGTASLSNTDIRNGITDDNGSAVRVEKGSLSLSNCTIKTCKSVDSGNGGAIYFADGTSGSLSNTTIESCIAAGSGGAIYVGNTGSGKAVTLNTVTIKNCKAAKGGAIYVANGGIVKLNTVTIQDCTATNGGAIYLESNATLHLQNVTIKNNTASAGAGVYLVNSAKLECKNSSGAAVNGGTFDNNDATGYGGSIYANNTTTTAGTVNLKGLEIKNSYGTQGGGIYMMGPYTFSLNDVTVHTNSAKYGGGINMEGNIQSTFTEVEIYGNSSYDSANNGNGGGMWIGKNSYEIVMDSTNSIHDNTSENHGGGIHLGGAVTLKITGATIHTNHARVGGGISCATNSTSGEPKLKIEGGSVYNNDARSFGGGICLRDGDEHALSGTANIYGNSAPNGGGVYLNWLGSSDATKLTMSSGQIYKNSATSNYAGGVYVDANCTLNMTGGNIGGEYRDDFATTSETQRNTYGNTSKAGAGVFVVAGGTLTMSGGGINSNVGTDNGGGIYNSGTMTINGGSVSNNKGNYGGGICIEGNCVNNVRITGSTAVVNINSNEATNDGGGIDISNGKGDVTGVVIGGDSGNAVNISQNIAKRGGGVRFRSSGNYSMSATIGDTVTMHKNQATHSAAVYGGGGIFMGGDTTLDIGAATLSENTAYCGGGIYIVGGSSTLTLNGTTLKDNVAVYSGGGLHTEAFKAITIENVTVDGNSAGDADHDGFGGGLSFYKGAAANTLTIKSGTITGNTSTDSGGGIFFSNDPTGATTLDVDLPKTASTAADPVLVISENTAKIGGGICVDDGSTAHALVTVNIHDGVDIHDNLATRSGGGIYVSPSGVVNMDGGKIRDNDADGGPDVLTKPAEDQVVCGGGVYVYLGTFNVTGGEISGNEAKSIDITRGLGGGIFVHGKATVSIKGTSAKPVVLSNNTANYRGGGLYITDFNTTTTPTFQMDYVNITGNTATNDRGGGAFMEFKEADGVRNVSITNCLVQNNTSETFAENDESVQGHGGGLYLSSSRTTPGTFTVTNVDFLDNHATVQGAGLYFTNYAKGVVTDCVFERNESKGDLEGTATGSGGGMAVYGGADVSLTDCTFDDNTATTNGGAIGLQGNTSTVNSQTVFNISKLSLTNVTIGETTANEAKANGGGINQGYLSELTVENCLVTKNISRNNGGGICVYTNYSGVAEANKPTYTAKTSISNTQVTNNTASHRGGGLYLHYAKGLNGDAVTLSALTITGNSATNDAGGGICVETSIVNMTGTNTVSGNDAGCYGGAIVVRTEDKSGATLNINTTDNGTTTIDDNSIRGYHGGGIHVAGSATLNMKGGSITNNDNPTRYYGGGGVDVQGTLNLNGTTVSGNTADNGGGICTRGSGSTTLTNCTVSGNTAANGAGGGLYASNGGTVKATNCFIIGNDANGTVSGKTTYVDGASNGTGGGVAVINNGSSFELVSGGIYNNTATTAGDDVFANGIGTKLSLPAAASINKSRYENLDATVTYNWMEDYMDGEEQYSEGLNGNSAIGGKRYLTSPVSVRAYVDSAEATGTGHTGEYINDEDGRFVAITFGVPKYNIGSIKITAPESDVPGQRFVFTLKGTNMLGETIELSVSLASKESVTITNLVSGTYTVEQQDDWSWRYEFTTAKVDDGDDLSTKAVSVAITGGELNELHTVTYTNEKENNKWLSHNSECEKNVALPETQNTAFYMAEAKKKYTL